MMKPDIDKYTCQAVWSEEDREFAGLCTEFPGLSWLAPDPDDAITGIRLAVKECIEEMSLSGEDIPVPIVTK